MENDFICGWTCRVGKDKRTVAYASTVDGRVYVLRDDRDRELTDEQRERLMSERL